MLNVISTKMVWWFLCENDARKTRNHNLWVKLVVERLRLFSIYRWKSLCPTGWPAFPESGKRPASSQHQASDPSPSTQQLWAQLPASSAIWWGASSSELCSFIWRTLVSLIPHVCSVHEQNNISPAEISQWTNHRVMEWLRSVDLAEYAPNLRGSGVHGGLMVRRPSRQSLKGCVPSSCLRATFKQIVPLQVLEPRFNVETMALLLNIPPNKTLLRRHLATHFSLLIGAEAQHSKQECLENPDYIVLTATTKVKVMHRFPRSGW